MVKYMIHYHGTPLSPRRELYKLAGRNFCVSFSDPRDAAICLKIGQSVMFDNGAFSAYTKGVKVNFRDYISWVEALLGPPHWAVIPDVIDGSEFEQRKLIGQWPFAPIVSAPVWHMNLPIKYLLRLSETWPRICFGSTARYWQIGSDEWCRRADEAFNALTKESRTIPWIHMLRGLSLAGDRWPFGSADSVNVARNYKDSHSCPERMARNIDAVQCPIKWHQTPEQKEMFI